MKPKNSIVISCIIISSFIITSFGFSHLFSHYISQLHYSSKNKTLEQWENILLNHNGKGKLGVIESSHEKISNQYDQIKIYQDLLNKFYSTEEQNQLPLNTIHTPEIRFLGPNNHPIEGVDLISHNDEQFELNFRLDDKNLNEWVVSVYAYLDYDIHDTIIGNSEKFEDGSEFKHFQPGDQPESEELNPDTTFLGNEFDKILEDHEQWTTFEKDYVARKNFLGRIDQEIYLHVKVLYKNEIYQSNGWHSYYYYVNFYISWYWTLNLQYRTLNIRDDDKVPPVISNVEILNLPIFDAYSEIDLEVDVKDNSGISELYIDFLGNRYYDNDNNNYISIPNPSIPGVYTLSISVVDNDIDRQGDQLTSSIYFNLNIIDDDPTPPQIIIEEDEFSWNVSIVDNDGEIDSKATGNYTLMDQYNTILDSGIIFQEDLKYYISKDLISLMKPMTLTLKIFASNNDYEWEGDMETTEAIRIIVITLEDCYQYVNSLIEDLKNYIKENVQTCFKSLFLCILNQTQIKLRHAYTQVIQGNIINSLDYLECALLYIKMIKSIINCISEIYRCNNIDLNYITVMLIDIRNNIVLLKGNSVDYGRDSDLGFQIAKLEVQVMELKDFIQENIDFCNTRYLKYLILRIDYKIKTILFNHAQDIDFSCLLRCTQNLLEITIYEIDSLLQEGKISLIIADALNEKINEIKVNLELIDISS